MLRVHDHSDSNPVYGVAIAHPSPSSDVTAPVRRPRRVAPTLGLDRCRAARRRDHAAVRVPGLAASGIDPAFPALTVATRDWDGAGVGSAPFGYHGRALPEQVGSVAPASVSVGALRPSPRKCRRARSDAAVLAVFAVCSLGLFAVCGDDKPETPAGARTITIDVPGGKLDAVEMGDGPVGVVLAHGASTTKEFWYPLMPALADAGMHVVALTSVRIEMAMCAPRCRICRTGAEQIVLIGSSLGGANVLNVASHDQVAAASPSRWARVGRGRSTSRVCTSRQ